jgi:hypothetical protein
MGWLVGGAFTKGRAGWAFGGIFCSGGERAVRFELAAGVLLIGFTYFGALELALD